MSSFPVVALVGRPNVGKSTLFNRIVGQKLAVVHDRPGTTRDRQHAEAEWLGKVFTIVDTGGIEDYETVGKGLATPLAEDSAPFLREMRQQAELAIAEADVIVLVVDVETGTTSADEEVADLLRKADKPVIIAANKADNPARRLEANEFYGLGFGDLFPISAQHGAGVGDLLDAIAGAMPHQVEDPDEDDERLKIAIVGRPNVGKSSLLNRLLGEERVIVSDVAGTTRDSIDTVIRYHGEEIVLIDTAGIRRRGKIDPTVERWSVLRALKAIKRADVVFLLIDAIEGITAQDTHIAGYVLDENKSVILLINKWDAVEKDTFTIEAYKEHIAEQFNFLPYAPIEFISAKTGQRVGKLIPLAQEVWEERYYRIPTAELNRLINEAMLRQAPPTKSGKRLKIRYASQVAIDPPKFLFHVNDVELAHFSYQRYLENQIRRRYPFTGTPLQLDFRRSSENRRKK